MEGASGNNRPTGRGATVGTFDGVHRGHEKVLETLNAECAARGLSPIVVTLDRHPLETVAPDRAPGMITGLEERSVMLGARVKEFTIIEFSPDIASLTAREWMLRLRNDFGVRLLVVGHDNTFGHDGRGMHPDDFRQLGRLLDIEVVTAPVVDGISSSAIRKAIANGDVVKAAEMLGRNYTLSGMVVKGRQLGRTIGFPTANIEPAYRAAMPKNGVYVIRAKLPDGKIYNGLANIGTKPTVSESRERNVEVFFKGFEGDLYGENLKIEFTARLRDERKFDTLELLRQQIIKDIRNIPNS